MLRLYLEYFKKFGSVRKKNFVMRYFCIERVDPGVNADDILGARGYTYEKFILELVDRKRAYLLYL